MRSFTTKLLSTEEVAKYLHISVGTVKNRLSRGDPMPPSLKIGRRQLFPSDEFQKWLNNRVVLNDGISIRENPDD